MHAERLDDRAEDREELWSAIEGLRLAEPSDITGFTEIDRAHVTFGPGMPLVSRGRRGLAGMGGSGCGHTTGRILHRLEIEQKIWYVHIRESKLPPPGACVTQVLNQSRLHTTRKKN